MLLLLAMLPAEKDREIFSRFYKKTYRTLYAAALQELENSAQAEDVVQDVYAELIERYREELGALEHLSRGYLLLRVRWRAKDRLRKEARLTHFSREEWETVLGEAPDQTEAAVSSQDRVDRLLSRLRPPYRELLELRLVLGLSSGEAAHRLGIRENTASVRYRRALAELRKELEKEEETP